MLSFQKCNLTASSRAFATPSFFIATPSSKHTRNIVAIPMVMSVLGASRKSIHASRTDLSTSSFDFTFFLRYVSNSAWLLLFSTSRTVVALLLFPTKPPPRGISKSRVRLALCSGRFHGLGLKSRERFAICSRWLHELSPLTRLRLWLLEFAKDKNAKKNIQPIPFILRQKFFFLVPVVLILFIIYLPTCTWVSI